MTKNRQPSLGILFVALAATATFSLSPADADEAPRKTPDCNVIEREVRLECTKMEEDKRYDAGDVSYMREQRLKDIPRCDNLAANIFHVCTNPAEKSDTAGDAEPERD